MSSPTTVSAIVAGFPAQLRQPRPLPGETLAQVAIRNNPNRWKVCVANLTSTHGVPKEACAQLLAGNFDAVTTPGAQREVERFVNLCLPAPGRTIDGLARLRDAASNGLFGYTISDILWPRETPLNPSSQAKAMAEKSQALADRLRVNVLSSPTIGSLALDLGWLLPHVHGEFLWMVPGGTRLPMSDPFGRLKRVIQHLTSSPRRALYSDNIASYVVRTSCLSELAHLGGSLPADPALLGRLLRQSGYELTGDENSELALCELEREFGGWSRNVSLHEPVSSAAPRPWWKKLFGG
jgi:hypothetical protein